MSLMLTDEPCSGLQQRIIQIHPALGCNLLCGHCYSSSGPSVKDRLELKTVCEAVSDASEMGYEVVSVSGGEPLMYEGLEQVLAHAKSLGMRTTMTTNGTLSSAKRLSRLQGCLDLMAISLDGPPELHNHVRASSSAFDRLLAGLENVRSAGFKFGFIHTLTRQSWEHLLWTAEFAAQQGASLLQLHPLELNGRAGSLMRADSPDDDVLARVYLLTLALARKYSGLMAIQLDVFNRNELIANAELVYASDLGAQPACRRPANQLGIIVLDADGSVVPLCYGFSKEYEICNVRIRRLSEAWDSYVGKGYLAFRELCREVFQEVCAPAILPFFNWHEMIAARSHAPKSAGAFSLPAMSKALTPIRKRRGAAAG
jgi:Fe-coproporphyrin III synthase